MPPQNKEDAKTLIRKRISDGAFLISPHAKKERDKDELTDVDIVNVLRGGIVDEAEFENGEWRHHVRTQKMVVVVAFEPDPDDAESTDEIELVIVTVWRKKP